MTLQSDEARGGSHADSAAVPDPGVTQILSDLERGDPGAPARLAEVVSRELRAIAGRLLAGRQPGGTIQPTLIADDVFMKLVRKTDVSWESRAHFYAVAAKAMRDLLVDHARARRAAKRGGGWRRLTVSALGAADDPRPLDLLALEDALRRLGEVDPRQERIVELRFFAGLSVPEVARLLGVSERTVLYDWRMARAWLRAELREGSEA